MSTNPAAPAARPARPGRVGRVPPSRSSAGPGRLRAAVYLVFAALALAAGLQAWSTLALDQARAVDAEIARQLAVQSTASQQMARLAALMTSPPVADDGGPPIRLPAQRQPLADLLESSDSGARTLHVLLARPDRGAAVPAVAGSLQAWQAARQRLADGVARLLRGAESGTDAALRQAAAALQADADQSAASAQALADQLHGAARQRAAQWRQRVELGLSGLLLLMAVLALAVIEPTARAARAQWRRLSDHAAQLRRLAMVAEQTQAMVIITDRQDRVQWVNAAFTRLSGWSAHEAQGRVPVDLLGHPNADLDAADTLRQAVAAGRALRQESLARARDGRDLWLDVDLCPLVDERGEIAGFISVAADVTTRVQHDQQLRALWAVLPTGVLVLGADGRIVDANRAAERLLGLSLAQLQGRDAVDPRWRVVREDGSPYPRKDQPAPRTLRNGVPLHNETLGIRSPDGSVRWMLVYTEPVHDPQGRITSVVSCISDVTDRRHLQDRLHANARTDALTQLPNRAVVMDRLRRAIAHAERHPGYGFAVLFMDFDRFKQVNDTLGHSVGDELLRQVAARLQSALRPGDAVARLDAQSHVAARIGGDEFVVVLDGVHAAEAVTAVADRLLDELGQPYNIGAHPVQSSVSIGIVLSSGAPRDADEILRNADTAMYEAKRAGRGRHVIFDHSMQERVVAALAVETDLRSALQDDELFVVYQPVVDLALRQMVGVEALVRWRHPQRGLVSPLEFIGVAEECGLIDAIGARVLQLACSQFMRWQHELGSAAPRLLAVNLSRAQLKRPAMVHDVARLLAETGMPAAQLQLEITESLAAQDECVQGTLRELKRLGVELALDDFGTGYSSLACLHQLPVDTVKIDRSFVQHAEDVEYHRVLIEATIRVARTLGMRTVAEGIETEGQAALMESLHCDRGQGWLFGRPMPADAISAWVRARDSSRDSTRDSALPVA